MPRDPLFESILDQVAEEYAAQEVKNMWLPPTDGQYTVHILKCRSGAVAKDDKKYLWAALTAQLLVSHDPEIDGKEIVLNYRTDNFRLKNDVAILNGVKVDDVRLSFDVLEASPGKLVTIDISTSPPNKVTGVTYRNAHIVQLLDTAPPENTPATADALNTESPTS